MNQGLLREKLSRRVLLKSSGVALAGTLLPTVKRAKANNALRPNVLMIFSDEESAVFEEEIRPLLYLPNREGLEYRGVRLTHAFVTAPQCSASRSTLMTALYPHQAGVVTNVDRTSLGRRLSPLIPTLGSVFHDHGYTTAYLGKWHLTDGLGGGVSPAHDHDALKTYGLDYYHFMSDSRAHHDQLAEGAANWIRHAPSSPWLLIVSFPFSPHDITRVAGLMRSGDPPALPGWQ